MSCLLTDCRSRCCSNVKQASAEVLIKYRSSVNQGYRLILSCGRLQYTCGLPEPIRSLMNLQFAKKKLLVTTFELCMCFISQIPALYGIDTRMLTKTIRDKVSVIYHVIQPGQNLQISISIRGLQVRKLAELTILHVFCELFNFYYCYLLLLIVVVMKQLR